MEPEKRPRLDEDESSLHADQPSPGVSTLSRIDVPECLLAVELRLTADIERGIRFGPPVEYVYCPVAYAFDVHSRYVRRYCPTRKKLLFLGMNAGPWGMSQTGVPFGEVKAVTGWLGLSGQVAKPSREHPARPVCGLASRRSEVSGKRFWTLFGRVCGTPENFFRHSFVRNYCPVALMDSAGRNVTPAEIKGSERRTLELLCDAALVAVAMLLRVETIVGVGRFAEKKARAVVGGAGLPIRVLYVPHPSPRSPTNVNWIEKTAEKLEQLDLLRFLREEGKR